MTFSAAFLALRHFWSSRVGATEPVTQALALGTWFVALFAQSAVLTAVVFAPPLFRTLNDALLHESPGWAVCVFLFPWSSLVLLQILGVFGFVLGDLITRRRVLVISGAGLSFLGALFAHADATLFHRFGRHLWDLLRYLKMPEGGEAAGDPLSNALLVLLVVFWSVLSIILLVGTHRLVSMLFGRLSRFWSSFSAVLALLLLGSVAASPWVLGPLLPDGLGPRLLTSLPLRPELFGADAHHRPRDPQLRALQDALTREYARHFAHVFRPLPPPHLDANLVQNDPPSVALIVAESLRWTQLTPEKMPRLFEWSKRGLRAERHYAASNHSESGLFVLLYGESALRYNTTLDQDASPTLCVLLRQAGYRCGYYTGHPKKWLRREEFLNDRTMDEFVHDRSGDWYDWDRSALQSAARALDGGKRRFALTFLMSSHFEYRYPPEYRKHLPDNPPRTGWLPALTRPEEFESCRNRYQNVTAFLDDLVADHIENLDPSKTLVIFTGDHGETTGENGRFGHGYDFSDPLARVPFVMVGPGVEPEVRGSISSHLDVLPSVLHALGVQTSGGLGRPIQENEKQRPLLSTYTTVGRPFADALLLVGEIRLALRLDPQRPVVEVLGFQDQDGRIVEQRVDEELRTRLTEAFRSQLEASGEQRSFSASEQ